MIADLYIKLAVAGVIATALATSHWKAYTNGKAAVQVEWNAEKLAVAAQSLELAKKVAADTATMQANADKLKGAKNAQINRLNTDLSNALERLRDSPSRDSTTGVPGDTPTGATTRGCTGAGLYKEDKSILLRLARDADELRINLKTCYQQYNAARDALAAPQPNLGK